MGIKSIYGALIPVLFCISFQLFGQTPFPASPNDSLHKRPQFINPEDSTKKGQDALSAYITEKIAPAFTEHDSIFYYTPDIIYVKFIVETDGSVREVEIIKYKGKPRGRLEQQVKEVFQSTTWTPGIVNGERARISFVMPLRTKYEKKRRKKRKKAKE